MKQMKLPNSLFLIKGAAQNQKDLRMLHLLILEDSEVNEENGFNVLTMLKQYYLSQHCQIMIKIFL